MTARKLFGTDGIRGKSNVFPMTSEVALKLGIASGFMFKNQMKDGYRHQVIIAKDTRLSGYMLENALAAGFTSVGMDVVFVGPLPTPAVAMLTRSMRVDLGVMISASHNPYQDNGIKLFAPDGCKLSDEIEMKIEKMMSGDMSAFLVTSDEVGRISRLESARGRYIEYVKSSFPKELTLDGIKVVIDCANGAAYKVAPAILWELGAEIIPLNVEPDGRNVNENSGALFPQKMVQEVLKHKADLGIALDGDADRVILSDEKGNVVDGDQIIALIATSWQKRGILKSDTVVTTSMSNMALDKFLQAKGLRMERANVGDRYVTEMMKKLSANLGGEQSGHIVLGTLATTGDGMMAALQVLAAMVKEKKKASELTSLFTPFPQKLKNVRFSSKDEAKKVMETEKVKEAIDNVAAILADKGRVSVRISGTEPLIRIMVESQDERMVDTLIDEIESKML